VGGEEPPPFTLARAAHGALVPLGPLPNLMSVWDDPNSNNRKTVLEVKVANHVHNTMILLREVFGADDWDSNSKESKFTTPLKNLISLVNEADQTAEREPTEKARLYKRGMETVKMWCKSHRDYIRVSCCETSHRNK